MHMEWGIKKKETGRWGDLFSERREWRVYNEELVVRGTFYLDVGWVRSWERELQTMNQGKRGSRFRFPESLIRLQAVWHQWIDYRGIEGITRMLVAHNLLPAYNDYSTTNRRVNKLSLALALPTTGAVHVACDGTGMKMNNAGEYRERKYGAKRRPALKVVITADPYQRKLLAVEVGIDGCGITEPGSALEHLQMLKSKGKHVQKFWGDPGLDDCNLFNWLDEEGVAIAIKPRAQKASDRPESAVRKKIVDAYMSTDYKQWAKQHAYGMRWVGTEGIFSAVKRKFGEHVRARKKENMLKEAERKFWAYDLVQQYAKS